jgi:hypothetical protein
MTVPNVGLRVEAPRIFSIEMAKRWAVTGAATVASTYALDALATAAGLLLVATQLLQGADHRLILLFLAGTYLLWGAGLRVNLQANWALLQDTGTSTNLLSKAAYDLVGVRSRNPRIRKIAAAIGYTGTELAKETPYYAGAFGAALLSDSVSANEALIFLGGANMGAAAYEYGLSHLVRAFLRRKKAATPAAYASFETEWRPREYLSDYYGTIEPDEQRTIAFFVDAMKDAAPGEPVLFIGVGPTLHHVFLAANKASEIHLGDYLPANLHEIERWMSRDAGAHDWRPFVRYTLQCEGIADPTEAEITMREDITRVRIKRLLTVDLRCDDPLLDRHAGPYGTVISAYCADSATDDRHLWEIYTQRIAGLVRPGGMLITAALRGTHSYVVGGKIFPSANVDENDLLAVLTPFFIPTNITIEVCELAQGEPARDGFGRIDDKGYSSVLLARARHRRDTA